MNFKDRVKSILPAVFAVMLAACASAHDDAGSSAANAASAQKVADHQDQAANLVDADGKKIELQEGDIVEGNTIYRKTEIKPAFTEATVLKLNAIVRRSLNAVNEFDETIAGIRTDVAAAAAADASRAVKAKAQKGVDLVGSYHDITVKSAADLKAEGAALDARGEYYNKTIFAGMVGFVDHVEQELGAEHQKLADQLAGKSE